MNMKLTISLGPADDAAGQEVIKEATETFPIQLSGANDFILIANGRQTLKDAIERLTKAMQEQGESWIETKCKGVHPPPR